MKRKQILTPEQKEAKKLYFKKWHQANKERLNTDKKLYYETNKSKINLKQKEYYENNKTIIIAKQKIYVSKNKIAYNKRKSLNDKKRRLNDPMYRLKRNFASSIKHYFKNLGILKNIKSSQILGCTIEDFKQHLESQFKDWMNWDDKGLYNGTIDYGWDVDHIEPMANAQTIDDIIRLNHYSNLRPLCGYINRVIKRDN